MKTFVSFCIFTILFLNTGSLPAQSLDIKTFMLDIQGKGYYDLIQQQGTAISYLENSGLAVGGTIVHVTLPMPGVSQGHIDARQFILRVDSSFNVIWVDSFMIWDDYMIHEVNSIHLASNEYVLSQVDTFGVPYIYHFSGFHIDSIDGTDLSSTLFEFDSTFLVVQNSILLNDTLFVFGIERFQASSFNVPMLVALNLNGDTLFTRRYTSFQNVYYVEIQSDNDDGLYLLINPSHGNKSHLLKIDSQGNVLHSDSVEESKARILDQDAVASIVGSGDLKFYNLSANQNDTVKLGCKFDNIFRVNDDLIGNCKCDSSSMLVPGRYLISFDRTGAVKFTLRSSNFYFKSIIELNDSVYAGTGTMANYPASDSLFVSYIKKPTFQRSLSSTSTSICDTNSVVITAPVGYVYHWSTGDSTQSIVVNQAGNYFAYISNADGDGTFTDTISLSNFAVPFDLGNDTVICHDQTIVLQAPSVYASYLWNTGSTAQFISASTSLHVDTINYFLSVVDSDGCTNFDTITVIFDVCSLIDTYGLEKINIIPNPAQSYITVEIIPETNMELNLEIFDLLGRSVLDRKIISNEKVDVSRLKQGTYFYIVSDYLYRYQGGKLLIGY